MKNKVKSGPLLVDMCAIEHIHTYIQKCFIYRHFIKTTAVCDETEKQINDETKCKLNQKAKHLIVGTGVISDAS